MTTCEISKHCTTHIRLMNVRAQHHFHRSMHDDAVPIKRAVY